MKRGTDLELKGIVKETDGKTATVIVMRKDACNHCAGKIICGRAQKYEIKAGNEIGAKPGDLITVSGSDRGVLVYAFLLFLLPIIASAVCYFVFFGINHTLGYVMAAVGFLLPYGIAAVVDRKLSGRLTVRITDIETEKNEFFSCDETSENK